MKIVVAVFGVLLSTMLVAQTVPVTFHYTPQISEFNKCRLVGTLNGWNNADAAMEMADTDGDGEYEITVDLPVDVQQMYKFVLDADWGLAWNDPHNPDFNPQDNNNSLITPTDPMISYLLPRDINSDKETFIDTTRDGEPIRAIFAYTQDNAIDPSTLVLTIDGEPVDNPQQFFDAGKKELYYQPTEILENGTHTISITANSPAGQISRSSTFERQSGFVILKAPVDFYYDEHNTRILFAQDVSDVSVVGSFNNWNDQFNQMQDDDGDGVWEGIVDLEKGYYEYKFKLNYFSWINDPDVVNFSALNDNNAFTVVIDSIPSIKLIGPNEARTITELPATLAFQALLRPGPSSEGIDAGSVTCMINGDPVDFNLDDDVLSADILLADEGRQQVDVAFANLEGVQTESYFTFGVYTGETGIYQADAAGDEPYTYPQNVASGSADILSVIIDENAGHDSLLFKIEMAEISDQTRLGLLISNSMTQYETEAPNSLDVLTGDWDGDGVFAFIGAPTALLNPASENRFMESMQPIVFSDFSIPVNASLIEDNIFQFTTSIRYLDSLMGSWSRDREFTLFSYLADASGSGNAFEVTMAENGCDDDIDPDVYDAAFIRNMFWQDRLLHNYVHPDSTNGPRSVALDGGGRGLMTLAASDISDSLAFFGPQITFLTPPVTYWQPELTVHGEILGQGISSAQFFFNGDEQTVDIVDGKFAVAVTLLEGVNTAYVVATDANHITGTSRELLLGLSVDHAPQVTIDAAVQGRTVTLTATGSSPDGLDFSYSWTADPDNPAEVTVGSGSEITVDIPQTAGEYYFDVLAIDGQGRATEARELIFATEQSVETMGIDDHAAWIDDAVVYEIYPRAFTEQGGFDGVVERIPDMLDLGINTIWFMPMYDGPTIHGYAITDYFGFEEDYGTERDFSEMIDALHNAGIRVILDFVVNHTSVEHRFMRNVLEYREYSPWKDFYIWEGEPGNSKYDFYFDWDTLPNLNYDTPAVHDYFINVAKFWINIFDIDGYRCDVAWGVQERNAEFWQEWRAELKNIKPEIFLQAEASSSEPVFYQQRFDSANDWDLRNLLLGAINGTSDIDALHAQLTLDYPDHARPLHFVENHDEVRIAASHDIQRSIFAHTLLMTMNGIPLIYSGGEVAELTNRNKIDWSDPPNIRANFKHLIGIHKKYIHNPEIQRLSNDQPNDIYSYASISDDDVVLTIANFDPLQVDVSVDLSTLPFEDDEEHYLTDLLLGTVTPVRRSAAYLILNMAGQTADVFYFGKKPVSVVADHEPAKTVKKFALYQNYPNPFNPSTVISFDLPREVKVNLTIFDVLGREVETLIDDELMSGMQEIVFDASSLPTGVYMYRLKTNAFIQTKKLLLLK